MTPPATDPAPPYRITLRNLIGITLLSVLIFVIGGVILVQLDPTLFTPEREPMDKLLWVSFLATAGVLASTGYVLASRTALGWGIVGLTRPHPRWLLIAVAAAAALFFAGERLDAILSFGIIENTRANFGPSLETEVGVLGLIAVMALVLPIPLEIYFRGVVFNYLRGLLGPESAIGISAALYGAVYYNPEIPIYMAYGVIHGAAFAVLFLRSGSLWTSIAANGTLGALLMAKVAWT